MPLVRSVSATTRPPRNGETDGVDYHFLSDEEFQLRRKRGDFLECFQVFAQGYWYGTLRSEVTTGLAAGKWVVLEIDVQGAQAVMRAVSRRDYHLPPAQYAGGTGTPAPRPRHRNRGGHPTAGWLGPIANWPWPTVTNIRSSTTTWTRRSRISVRILTQAKWEKSRND